MFSKIAAAVIAVSLIAGPALAQNPGNAGTSNAPATTSQPAAKADVNAKHSEMKVSKARKHLASNLHHRKHVKHVKFVRHVKHVKHLKQVKRFNHQAKTKISG
jgi:hypothetical protein